MTKEKEKGKEKRQESNRGLRRIIANTFRTTGSRERTNAEPVNGMSLTDQMDEAERRFTLLRSEEDVKSYIALLGTILLAIDKLEYYAADTIEVGLSLHKRRDRVTELLSVAEAIMSINTLVDQAKMNRNQAKTEAFDGSHVDPASLGQNHAGQETLKRAAEQAAFNERGAIRVAVDDMLFRIRTIMTSEQVAEAQIRTALDRLTLLENIHLPKLGYVSSLMEFRTIQFSLPHWLIEHDSQTLFKISDQAKTCQNIEEMNGAIEDYLSLSKRMRIQRDRLAQLTKKLSVEKERLVHEQYLADADKLIKNHEQMLEALRFKRDFLERERGAKELREMKRKAAMDFFNALGSDNPKVREFIEQIIEAA